MQHFNISNNEKDIILGCLLGDGGIYKRKDKPNSYVFTLVNTQKDYIDHVHSSLHSFDGYCSTYTVPRQSPRKTIYQLRLANHHFFKELYKDFYGGSHKSQIPNWLNPNPVICYHMYVGDGHLSDRMQLDKRKGATFRILRIVIATDCFNIITLNRFFDSLNIYYRIHKHSSGGWQVFFNGSSAREFLEYIGTPQTDGFTYKWAIRDDLYGTQRRVLSPQKKKFLIAQSD